MIVYAVFRDFPNTSRLLFRKTLKDRVGVESGDSYIGLLTETQMKEIGGHLLTMSADNKIILYRNLRDSGLEFMSVTLWHDTPFVPSWVTVPHEVLATIDRETLFDVKDCFPDKQCYLYKSSGMAEYVPAAVFDEVHQSRYTIMWDFKVGPMPMNTQLFARKSDVAKLSGNIFEQAGLKVSEHDESTDTLLLSSDPAKHMPTH